LLLALHESRPKPEAMTVIDNGSVFPPVI